MLAHWCASTRGFDRHQVCAKTHTKRTTEVTTPAKRRNPAQRVEGVVTEALCAPTNDRHLAPGPRADRWSNSAPPWCSHTSVRAPSHLFGGLLVLEIDRDLTDPEYSEYSVARSLMPYWNARTFIYLHYDWHSWLCNPTDVKGKSIFRCLRKWRNW